MSPVHLLQVMRFLHQQQQIDINYDEDNEVKIWRHLDMLYILSLSSPVLQSVNPWMDQSPSQAIKWIKPSKLRIIFALSSDFLLANDMILYSGVLSSHPLRYGIPSQVYSDNGTEFIPGPDRKWRVMPMLIMGTNLSIDHHVTTSHMKLVENTFHNFMNQNI